MSFSKFVPTKAQSLTTHMVQGTTLAVVLTAASYILALHFGWIPTFSGHAVEGFAVFTSYLCTYLCVVERRANYPIGAISNAAYCFFFASLGLVGSAIVTGYLTFSLAYGWFRWKKDEVTKPVAFVELKWWPVYLGATAVAFLVGLTLYPLFGQAVVWTDAVVMAASILAQFLLDNKKLENWLVWMVVNVFAIYTYINAGAALAAFQYVFFLLNAFYGFYMWRRSMKNEETATVDTSGPVPAATLSEATPKAAVA
jgi:nicotinamide mononucleotide transporter